MTLDERVARDCQRSGVPFHVEDDQLLDRVAAWLVLGQEGEGDGRAA
jgi:hypothetical protein